MKSKDISLKDICLLKEVYNDFNIKDSATIIDLFALIKYFDDNLSPRKVSELFVTEFDSDFFESNKNHINKYNNSNYLGTIRRKYKRSGIVSLFHHQLDFLDAFLQKYPSPQDVNLPFWNWNIKIIQHYIKLKYEKFFPEYVLKKVLSSIPEYKTNPFISSCRNYFNSNNFHFFVWDIKFIKSNKKSPNKYTEYIPIRFDYKNMETNQKTLKSYNVQSNNKNDNIFLLLRRCIPSNNKANECIFLIIKTNYKESYFLDEFLKLDYNDFLATKYVFINLSDIKTMFNNLPVDDLEYFYNMFKPCHKSINNYIKLDLKNGNHIKELRTIITSYFA